jgi:hypothetical protein
VRTRAGCIWRSCSTCTHARSWAGRWENDRMKH